MALVTISQVKEMIPLTGTTYDTVLTSIVDYVSKSIESYTGRSFSVVSATEYFDMKTPSKSLFVKYPISAVTEINVDPDRKFTSNTALDLTTDVFIDYNKGQIIYDLGWPTGTRHIKVVYDYGYSVVPLDVQLAAIYWSIFIYNEVFSDRRDRASLSLPTGEAMTFQGSNPPAVVKLLLDKYNYIEV